MERNERHNGADERGRTVDLLITNYQRSGSWYERKRAFPCVINALILSPHKRSCNQSWYERIRFESHTKQSGTKVAHSLLNSMFAGVSFALRCADCMTAASHSALLDCLNLTSGL